MTDAFKGWTYLKGIASGFVEEVAVCVWSSSLTATITPVSRPHAKPCSLACLGSAASFTCSTTHRGYVSKLDQRVPVSRRIRSIFNAPDANEATRLLGLAIEGWRSAHPKLAAWDETNLAEGFRVFALPAENRVPHAYDQRAAATEQGDQTKNASGHVVPQHCQLPAPCWPNKMRSG